MSDIFVPKKFLGDVIDRLRDNGENTLADKVQFGEEGDKLDEHRCRMCEKLAGGDRSHRCWDKKWQEENFKLYPCSVCGKLYSVFDPKIFSIDPYACGECRKIHKILTKDARMLDSEESQLRNIKANELVAETMKIFEAEKIELVRRFGWTNAAEEAKKTTIFKMLKHCLVQRFDMLCYVLVLCDREPSFKHVCLKCLTEDFPEIALDIGTRDFLEEE